MTDTERLEWLCSCERVLEWKYQHGEPTGVGVVTDFWPVYRFAGGEWLPLREAIDAEIQKGVGPEAGGSSSESVGAAGAEVCPSTLTTLAMTIR